MTFSLCLWAWWWLLASLGRLNTKGNDTRAQFRSVERPYLRSLCNILRGLQETRITVELHELENLFNTQCHTMIIERARKRVAIASRTCFCATLYMSRDKVPDFIFEIIAFRLELSMLICVGAVGLKYLLKILEHAV